MLSNVRRLGWRRFSTLAVAPDSFRTPENNPLNHTDSDLDLYYRLSPETKKQLFLYGGLPRTFEIQSKTFTEHCLMVRRPSLDVIDCMRALDGEDPRPTVRFVLYGRRGTGKSLGLAHIIHYAHEAGRLLVHVPWVALWTRRCKESTVSESSSGRIDTNLDAAAWLIHFKNQNGSRLADLTTTETHEWSRRESTPAGSPLVDLIDHGINRVKYASRCVVALAGELKRSGRRILVALDGYNAFFGPDTNIKIRTGSGSKTTVKPADLTVTEAFLELSRFDWPNGVVVAVVDELAVGEEDQKSHLPRYLLGKAGFEHLDPFVPVLVEPYTARELRNCMDYYRERRWVLPVDGQDDEVTFLSASNPYRLMMLCNGL